MRLCLASTLPAADDFGGAPPAQHHGHPEGAPCRHCRGRPRVLDKPRRREWGTHLGSVGSQLPLPLRRSGLLTSRLQPSLVPIKASTQLRPIFALPLHRAELLLARATEEPASLASPGQTRHKSSEPLRSVRIHSTTSVCLLHGFVLLPCWIQLQI
uniref:Predicted protein n=1 Tax=Hordeum vulgare subsp. vulgare TaxID=112509 RepID=F2CTL1_HORVV|nr:predicted protein [Hordeum vulgare subsp. vulgare]